MSKNELKTGGSWAEKRTLQLRRIYLPPVVFMALLGLTIAAQASDSLTQKSLHGLNSQVLTGELRESASTMLRTHTREQIQQANDRSSEAWRKIKTLEQWERFRDERIAALRKSLGSFPERPKKVKVHVTATRDGVGFMIKNLVFESRPGLWVTANLYLPKESGDAMPGILIAHSHHRPKDHGELQDMGMSWARNGCVVLVMDQLGHGERRQHPFRTEADYGKEFRWSRQDYYFRFDVGAQLHLIGESLVGWMAGDLMRGVDLLLDRKDVDPKRIVLLGAVAGGGDVVAVTAAIDSRIAAVVPFNFGGPQGFTRYPLPDDAEKSFNYAGSGSWESTRNLHRSCADGFLPWVIVGSTAPRRLIYAHEFRWDKPRDPVWKRLQTIYGFYEAEQQLGFAHGRGSVKGRPSEATHCTHIGRTHRAMMHPYFDEWFGIKMDSDDENTDRLPAADLNCWTPEFRKRIKPKPVHVLLDAIADGTTSHFRQQLGRTPLDERRQFLQRRWSEILGPIDPARTPAVRSRSVDDHQIGGAKVERITLETEPGIVVPMLLLIPKSKSNGRTPVVIAVAQSGKAAFLRKRTEAIEKLVNENVAVCLPDLRGTGGTRLGDSRGAFGADTSVSSSELMLGRTTIGGRLRDARSVICYLKSRDDIDGGRLAMWGDSFSEPNPPDTDFKMPRRVEGRPRNCEPLGGLIALLAACYESDVRSLYIHRGLSGYRSVLSSQQVLIPHDVVIPGVLGCGDLNDLAAAISPTKMIVDSMVDGLNRTVAPESAKNTYSKQSTHIRFIDKSDRHHTDWVGRMVDQLNSKNELQQDKLQ